MDPASIEAWLALAEKYGVSLVLLVILTAIVIIGGYGLARWLGHKVDELWTLSLGMKRALPDPAPENVRAVVELNLEVKSCLTTVMAEMDAQWGQLWSFHNGVHGIGTPRVPFMFLALTHQATTTGTLADLSTFGALPLSWFDSFMVGLLNNQTVEFRDNPEIAPTPMGKMIQDLGAKTAIARAVRDRNDQIIGFVMILWQEVVPIIVVQNHRFVNGCQQMTAIISATEAVEETK